MDFPVIPEQIEALSNDDLTALRSALRQAGLDLVAKGKSAKLSDDDLSNARLAQTTVARIGEIFTEREAEAAELDAIADGLAEDEAPAELDDESTEDEVTEDDEVPAEDDEDEVIVPDEVTAAVPAKRTATAGGTANRAKPTAKPPATQVLAQKFTALAGVDGFAPGDRFEDTTDIGKALVARWSDIRGGGTESLGVAKIEGRFAPGSELALGDYTGFVSNDDAITAGMDCVPREPIYDVGCDSSVARPFANSLPNRKAPRGGYSVYPSPLLADVTDGTPPGDGTGVWERADDAIDSGSVKAACAVIPCGTPDDYDIYGVYRCMTVRNLHQMTHPELVAAFLNKLGALWARLAEVTLLEAALNSPNVIDLTGQVADDLGATVNILDNLVLAATVYTEQERYDDGIRFGVWMHRWVLTLLIRDWMRAPRFNPSMADLVAARSEVESAFTRAGFNVHWVMDSPAGWDAVDTQTAGALKRLPTTVDMLIGREGNQARLDEGSMTIGVTNRSPWDKEDMARNQFTMFWESYEGLIDYGCPSYSLSIGDLCPSGLVNYQPEAAPACVHGS